MRDQRQDTTRRRGVHVVAKQVFDLSVDLLGLAGVTARSIR
ncbi:hypothetical protein [Rhizobium mulingense]|nr:hypothetical protein [Rhizobium sp. MJ21]MEB3046707.1 hypothetical protein [Rhizobium sp. MJ21]